MKRFQILLLGLLIAVGARAQFYNGMQHKFGKSRVQYNHFEWMYYRFERFDTYFYTDGMELAQYASEYAKERLPYWESFFNNNLETRILFLLYNKQSEFKQSNIGLVTGSDEGELGGTQRISANKAYLYFDGDHEHFKQQIDARIIEMLINQSFYGGSFSERVATRSLLKLPPWYVPGLIAYLSEGWPPATETLVHDKIASGRFKRLNGLPDDEARLAGQSIWNFIARKYGDNIIPSVIYLTKSHKNYEAGFNFVLGEDFVGMRKMWLAFYENEIQQTRKNRNIPEGEAVVKRGRKTKVYQHVAIDPNGKLVAYVTNKQGRLAVWLYDQQQHQRRKLFTSGHRLQQITDYSYPMLAWHPNGRTLAFVTEEKGQLWIYFYETEKKELTRRYIPDIDKVHSFSYSPDGFKIAMSAVDRGRTDIFVYDVLSRNLKPITEDTSDDFYPTFANKHEIVFSSRRYSDTLQTEKRPLQWATNPLGHTPPKLDLFLYNTLESKPILRRLSNTPFADETQTQMLGTNKYLYLSNENGINNLYRAQYDSAISRIDTAIHYRFFAQNWPASDFATAIQSHSATTQQHAAQLFFNEKRYRIYAQSRIKLDSLPPLKLSPSAAFDLRKRKQEQARQDAIARAKAQEQRRIDSIRSVTVPLHPDTQALNVNNYVFENEKLVPYQSSEKVDSLINSKHRVADERPGMMNYLTAFYTDYMAGQVDLSFANDFYQSFSGAYFNPGVNFSFLIGTKDLFEDYKMIGGLYIAPDLSSYNYMLGYEVLGKRWDKQFYFQEQSYKQYYQLSSSYSLPVETKMYKVSHVSSYPLSQVTTLRATVGVRYDKLTAKSQDAFSLQLDGYRDYWANIKLEYVFDNSFVLGQNLYDGAKFKFWTEFHKQIDGAKSDMTVLGLDLRYSLPLHRNIVWANRFAASTSFGHSRLMYYLGGVDNWWNFTSTPTFDYETPINYDINYAFQANATNLRGFSQNTRNGTTFFLYNSELRVPVFSYLFNRQLRMTLLRDFQAVAFFDLGSAWSGRDPFDPLNNYNYEVIEQNGLTITVHNRRSPIIFGYGVGMRTTLLGYFVRADWAWGVDDWTMLPRVFYFSVGYDF